MGSPISPLEAIDLIKKGIALYKEIKSAPAEIQKIGERMESMDTFMSELTNLIEPKNKKAVALTPIQVASINTIITNAKADAQQVYDLLEKWDNNIGPGGFEYRFTWVAHTIFTLRSSPDKLEALIASIERHLDDIHRFIGLFTLQKLLNPGPQPANTAVARRSPSPQPPKTSYNILFVDGPNIGRSRVAEAYCKLAREWTRSKGLNWPVFLAHSAGITIRNKGGCVNEVQKLDLTLFAGDKPPNAVAMASLFDNQFYNHSYKQEIKKTTMERTSRGLSANTFSTYDFVFAFTKLHQLNLSNLRQLLVEKHGPTARAKGKGKIVLLGDYSKNPGSQIFEPADVREKWDKTTAQIKIAVKGFLAKETGWSDH